MPTRPIIIANAAVVNGVPRSEVNTKSDFGFFALNATHRSERLAAFTTEGLPPAGKPMEVLCEDKSGTYLLPFACYWESEALAQRLY